MKPKKIMGGARIGAGRPISFPTKIITFRIRLTWDKAIRKVVAAEIKRLKGDGSHRAFGISL